MILTWSAVIAMASLISSQSVVEPERPEHHHQQQQQQQQHHHHHQQQQQQQQDHQHHQHQQEHTHHNHKHPRWPLLPGDPDWPKCNLGNDTYQLGERWNPNLPPFGVQVCVQCECIIRPRKNARCYETKVTCRRIINECPIIESCPDGKKPVTIAGQCCKSCENQPVIATLQFPTIASILITTQPSSTPTKTLSSTLPTEYVYKNDRIKEYESLIGSMHSCPKQDNSLDRRTSSTSGSSLAASKSQKAASKNDINGIDTRLVFKSLQDTQTNNYGLNKGTRDRTGDKINIIPSSFNDTLRHDHQHPNDVQSASSATLASNQQQPQPQQPIQHKPNFQKRLNQPYGGGANSQQCILGNDTYQIGDRWSPVLPPFGVQVCVQCECIIRPRKNANCYETKVTCRRISNECPVLEWCPDGKKPLNIAGQCCKSCENQPVTSTTQPSTNATTEPSYPITQAKISLEPIQLKSGDRLVEYESITKSLQACQKQDGRKRRGTVGLPAAINMNHLLIQSTLSSKH